MKMHECVWFKQKGSVKESYQVCRKKTHEALTLKKIKKKNWLRGIERDRRERQKNEEQCSDSSYFLLKKQFWSFGTNWARNQKCFKNKFDWSKGIKLGLEF